MDWRFGGRGGFYTAVVVAFLLGVILTAVVQASRRGDDDPPPECYTVGRWVFTEANYLDSLVNEPPGFHTATQEQIDYLLTLARIRQSVCKHFDE
jgi:hypothetical protein